MRTSPIVLSAILVGIGCAGDTTPPAEGPTSSVLRIESPADGDVLTSATVRVSGSTDIPDATEVAIAGQLFPVSGGRFEGDVTLAEGPNQIVAQIGDEATAVNVIVDTAAPVITIESPTEGAFVEGDIFSIRGHVIDATLEELTISGAPVTVREDGSFELETVVEPGAHRARIHAIDRAGRETYAFAAAVIGHFQDDADPLPDALVLEAGEDALATIADGIEPYLASTRLAPLVMSANPVIDGFWGELDVEGESHGPAEMLFTPREGSLGVAIALPDVWVPLRADLSIGGDVTGDLTCTRAVARAEMTLSASGGRPVVTVDTVEVSLEGLLIDVHGLWSWIDRAVVTAAARDMLIAQIEDMIRAEVPVQLETALSQLDGIRTVEVASGGAVLRNDLTELHVSYDGLRAMVDMSLEATKPVPELADRSLGVLVTSGEAPTRAGFGGMFAALSTDVLGSAAHGLWVSGGIDRRFDEIYYGSSAEPLNMRVLAAFVPALSGLAPPEAALIFEIEAILPPIAEKPAEGILAAEIADLRIRAHADTGDGELIQLFEVSADVRAELRVLIVEDVISVDVVGFAVTAEVVSAPAGVPVGADLDELIAGIVGPKIEELVRYDIAIPTFAGFRLSAPAATQRDGYLRFEASLDRVD